MEQASKLRGEEYVDLALFTDGLRAEREQRITIDVAYRFFATPKRKFIIADTPGHIQYTRNMVTGASTAELAIILIDAQRGVLTQSKRHGFIASLLQIPHILVAVNKMDLVDYREDVFEHIAAEYTAFASKLSVPDLTFIPISALLGDNVVHQQRQHALVRRPDAAASPGARQRRRQPQPGGLPLPGADGDPAQLTTSAASPARSPPAPSRPARKWWCLPSGRTTRVRSIVTFDGELAEAAAGDSVMLTLEDEIDISRGDMIVRVRNLPQVEHSPGVHPVLDERGAAELDARRYILQHTTRQVRAYIDELTYRIDMDTLHREPAETLALNEIGRVKLTTTQPIFFDSYQTNRATGNFILIDPVHQQHRGRGHDPPRRRTSWPT